MKEETSDKFELPAANTKAGVWLSAFGFTLPWLLAAPALIIHFGL